MNKTTDHFKRTIQAYLDSRAAEDKLFAANYNKPNKNIEDCVTYIFQILRKQCVNKLFQLGGFREFHRELQSTEPLDIQ